MTRRWGAALAVAVVLVAGCSTSKHTATSSSASSTTTSTVEDTSTSTSTSSSSSTSTSTTSTTVKKPTVTMVPVATTATTKAPTSTTTAAPTGPCTGTAAHAYTHVVWILFENKASTDVEGSASAPYFGRLGGECGIGTNYAGISHPSLPNYIALTSGGTQGITDDNDPSAHPLSAPSLFSLLGANWRALDESMPSNCSQTSSGEYAVRHNPAAYYTNIQAACNAQDVPLGATPDLSARFTFITPNLCNDMHDCSVQTGDTWLSHEMPLILASPQYQSGSTAVFVTFDENDSGGTLVPLYVIAPSVHPGTRSAQASNHYSLLRTTEELLGLQPLLGGAATASSLASAYNL